MCVWVRPDQIRLWTLNIYREVPDASTKNEPAGPKEKFGCVSLRRGGRVSEWIDHTGTGLAYYCTLLSNEEVKLEQLDLVGSDTVIIP